MTDPKKITDGSNGFALAQVLGVSIGVSGAGASVHLDDVAKLHALSLNPAIPGNTHYILNSGGLDGTVWSAAIGIVARNYPEAVAKGVLLNNRVMETHKLRIDTRKVERVFGWRFRGFRSLTDNYLGIV